MFQGNRIDSMETVKISENIYDSLFGWLLFIWLFFTLLFPPATSSQSGIFQVYVCSYTHWGGPTRLPKSRGLVPCTAAFLSLLSSLFFKPYCLSCHHHCEVTLGINRQRPNPWTPIFSLRSSSTIPCSVLNLRTEFLIPSPKSDAFRGLCAWTDLLQLISRDLIWLKIVLFMFPSKPFSWGENVP